MRQQRIKLQEELEKSKKERLDLEEKRERRKMMEEAEFENERFRQDKIKST